MAKEDSVQQQRTLEEYSFNSNSSTHNFAIQVAPILKTRTKTNNIQEHCYNLSEY